MIVRLPRNYAFFARLPLQFKMKVVRFLAQNQGKFWYEVQIHGHSLRISSLVKLQEGKTYEIKQKSALEMEVLREVKENQTIEKNHKIMQDDSSRNKQVDSIKWISWILQFATSDFDSTIRIFTESKNIVMQPTENGYYFEKGNPVQVAGFFQPRFENYVLYLYINSEQPIRDMIKQMEGKILYTEKIFPVTYNHLQTLRRGLNVES
ncbi:MAG: hypothetical protein D6767_02235 [Candidatus Hydrogenedentota bacterium]|nr:MAG: hypothetical protein D6767_02235 [Candidatus Hydrogenedentota bacterium]